MEFFHTNPTKYTLNNQTRKSADPPDLPRSPPIIHSGGGLFRTAYFGRGQFLWKYLLPCRSISPLINRVHIKYLNTYTSHTHAGVVLVSCWPGSCQHVARRLMQWDQLKKTLPVWVFSQRSFCCINSTPLLCQCWSIVDDYWAISNRFYKVDVWCQTSQLLTWIDSQFNYSHNLVHLHGSQWNSDSWTQDSCPAKWAGLGCWQSFACYPLSFSPEYRRRPDLFAGWRGEAFIRGKCRHITTGQSYSGQMLSGRISIKSVLASFYMRILEGLFVSGERGCSLLGDYWREFERQIRQTRSKLLAIPLNIYNRCDLRIMW